MNCDGAYCIGSVCAPYLSVVRIRGELAMRAHFRATDLYAVGSFDSNHDAVMRIGGEAPDGGPILSVGIGATSATGSRHLGSSTGSPVVDASSERRASKEMILQRFVSLPDAG